jgi:heme-degrading monooxygenase HmoA
MEPERGTTTVIAVIFELWPTEGKTGAYLDIAGGLRPMLRDIEGFISVERFESITEPGKYLSLSFWRDEEAVAAWRRTEEHRDAQAAGRGGLFRDYRLRVASVSRDYGMNEHREAAPADSREVHDEG